jgi:hypothetical protein
MFVCFDLWAFRQEWEHRIVCYAGRSWDCNSGYQGNVFTRQIYKNFVFICVHGGGGASGSGNPLWQDGIVFMYRIYSFKPADNKQIYVGCLLLMMNRIKALPSKWNHISLSSRTLNAEQGGEFYQTEMGVFLTCSGV